MKKKAMPFQLLLILLAMVLPGVAQNPNSQMRFKGLDRNKDGVITREEWRGNNQSFANEDWNGDGVLSGDEVRPGARRTGDKLSSERSISRFRDMDTNRDDVISRDEWRGDRRTFDRLDTNRNGMLNSYEFVSTNNDRVGRFADLDRNNNGVIERNEWDDDRQSFDALDGNRDGLLGSDELYAVDSANRTRSFADLDTNRDGRISRSEWRGTPREFDYQDSNRDGVVSRDELQRTFDQRSIDNTGRSTITISRGSEFVVRTNENIDSKTAAVGQQFSALIERDIVDNSGKLAIPKGSDARLIIRQTEGGGSTNTSELILDINTVTVNGIRYLVATEDMTEKGRDGIGANRRTGVMVGGGAGLGALIGAIAGGGKGAAIGAGVGAAAGAAGQILTQGGEVRVPAETVLSFKLETDLILQRAY